MTKLSAEELVRAYDDLLLFGLDTERKHALDSLRNHIAALDWQLAATAATAVQLRTELDRVKAERDALSMAAEKNLEAFREARALAEKYREALEWYADGLTWLESFNSACAARSDRGAKARQALEGGEK